jgi:hypothetical protein
MVVAFPNASNSGLLSKIRCTIVEVVGDAVVVVVVVVVAGALDTDDSEMVAK